MADGLLHVPWSALWRPSADCVVCVQFVACGWLIPGCGQQSYTEIPFWNGVKSDTPTPTFLAPVFL